MFRRAQEPLAVAALLALSSVGGCDSGFEKAADEPEPEEEPIPEPDEAPEAGATSGFTPPQLDFEVSDESAALSELPDGERFELCQAEQDRLDEVFKHFSSDDELCRIIAIREASRDAGSNTAYANMCTTLFAECLEEGPDRTLGDYLPIAASTLACESWDGAESCDPSVSESLACLDDVVENLANRLSDLGSCASTRAEVEPRAQRLDELLSVGSPLELSNRCAPLLCLIDDVDGGL